MNLTIEAKMPLDKFLFKLIFFWPNNLNDGFAKCLEKMKQMQLSSLS